MRKTMRKYIDLEDPTLLLKYFFWVADVDHDAVHCKTDPFRLTNDEEIKTTRPHLSLDDSLELLCRFRVVLELFSRFQFDLRRCGIFFLNDSIIWCVRSSITHNVAVHVHVLWPVCTHTTPFRMLWRP